jgi:hypothetical protein
MVQDGAFWCMYCDRFGLARHQRRGGGFLILVLHRVTFVAPGETLRIFSFEFNGGEAIRFQYTSRAAGKPVLRTAAGLQVDMDAGVGFILGGCD